MAANMIVPGGAEHVQVGGHVVVEEHLGQAERVEVDVLVLARVAVDRDVEPVRLRELHGRRRHHRAGRHLAGLDHRDRAVGARVIEVLWRGRDEDVEAEIAVGGAGRDLVGTFRGVLDNLQVRDDRPAFWLSPVWSRPRTCLPSSSAAVPSTWFTVTTPVPPMPIMKILASRGTLSAGSGSVWSTLKTRRAFFCGGPSGTIVTNDEQSPFRHE